MLFAFDGNYTAVAGANTDPALLINEKVATTPFTRKNKNRSAAWLGNNMLPPLALDKLVHCHAPGCSAIQYQPMSKHMQ